MTRFVPAAIAFTITLVACQSEPDRAPARPTDAGVAESPASIEHPADADQIPCAPRRVLETVCQQCHTRPMRNGAPFPLEGRSDVLAVYLEEEVRLLMAEELVARRMPLAPVTISNGDRETLLVWLQNGAPAMAPSSCGADGTTNGEKNDPNVP